MQTKITITSSGPLTTACTVTGECEEPDQTPITCTISKDSFSQTKTTTVTARRWSVNLGAPTPIPVDTGYKIVAECPNGGTQVDNISVVQSR